MAVLKIVTGPKNSILRAMSEPVKKFDSELRKFVKDMKDTMLAANGLGIAAPQVGVNLRAYIVTLGYGKHNKVILPMINPQILWTSEEMEEGEEGCLSIPGKYDKVARHRKLKVEFFDADGNRQIFELEDLDARVVQHETDHINGMLYIDRVGK